MCSNTTIGVPLNVPDKAAALIVGFVRVLLLNVSVVALPTNVSVTAGSVIVTSSVDAGPISVALFVPSVLSSNNSIKPAEVDPFLTDIPALNTH